MIPREARRKLLLFVFVLFIVSCAGAPDLTVPVVPDVGTEPPADIPADLTLYFPLESAALADTGRTGSLGDSLLLLRFDRPGAWSIYPERFLFLNDDPRVLEPIQIFGSSELRRIDMVLLRTEPIRPAGFLEGNWGKEFFNERYTGFPLPEALLFLDRSYLKAPLTIDLTKDSPQYKQGMQELSDLPPESRRELDGLAPEIRSILADVLGLGSAGGSRRGFRSLLAVPFDAIPIEAYDGYGGGMDLELTFSFDPEKHDFPGLLTLNPMVRPADRGTGKDKSPAADWLEDVRIGDLGVFSGATPLLDPKVSRVAGEVYQSGILTRIGQSRALRPSPVLWEGSFNAYMDERRKFLFSPGIFSYIPGKHPDLSSGDVRKVTGMEQYEFDSLLQKRSVVTLQHAIYGVIPAFIAASGSPTELEIAFAGNRRLRDSLKDFLNREARLIWLD